MKQNLKMTTVGNEGTEKVDVIFKETKTIKEKPHITLGL